MTLRIGSKKNEDGRAKGEGGRKFFCFFELRTSNFEPRSASRRGFTLIEAMVAVSILSFGILGLYQAFFISVDAAQMAVDRLAVQEWAERKIWDEEEAYRKTHEVDLSTKTGTFKAGKREFSWVQGIRPIERNKSDDDFAMEFVDQNIKSLILNVTWRAGGHERGMIFGDALSF